MDAILANLRKSFHTTIRFVLFHTLSSCSRQASVCFKGQKPVDKFKDVDILTPLSVTVNRIMSSKLKP